MQKKQKYIWLFARLFVSLHSELSTMKKTLSARLTYRIMAVVLVMMSIIASVVYFTVRQYMLDEVKERYLSILLKNRQDLRRRLSDVHVAVENNVHDIERDIDNPDMMFDHMERMTRLNKTIACSSILFEHGYYPSKGKLFIPCARKDSDGNVKVTRIDSTYHSFFYGKWFQERTKQNNSSWSKPYYESKLFAGDQCPRLLTTYCAPIHNHEGRPVALLAADLSLEWLREKIMEDITKINNKYEKDKQHQSYFFIIDKKGTYIIHPDRKRILTTIDEDLGKMLRANRGTCTTEVDGVKSLLYYRSVKHVDWVMVIVAPEDVVMSNGRMLNIIILATMIIGIIVIYLLCRHQIKGIADPFVAQKAALERELTIAHNIQMALLPKPFPEHTGIDLYASQAPAREVGGDLYDYFQNAGHLVFCIGDVSGKSVPAALLMAVMKSMFRSEAYRAKNAAEIVETMNRTLCEEYTGGDFITMFVGILDLATGSLDYCNAGHEAPILAGQPLPIIPNLPIGALSDWTYKGQQAQLMPGNMLFLFTDGLNEAMNDKGKQFGRKHVMELSSKHSTESAYQLIELMQDEVKCHVGNATQSDDITLLAIKWLGNSMTMKASMDDISRLEPFITKIVKQSGMNNAEEMRLRLAVEEAVANIINHGHATTITLQAAQEDTRLVLTLDDDGVPFDPTIASKTDLSIPADQRPPGGLGIILLHEMTEGLSYQRINGHNILKIIKKKN